YTTSSLHDALPILSKRIPLPEHAPAARPIAEYTVMSWHWLVGVGLSLPWVSPLIKPAIAPVRGSINTRGLFTTAAFCGAASGTLIMSMRNRAVLGFCSGAPPEHPASSSF